MPAVRHVVMGLALVLTVIASVWDGPWPGTQGADKVAVDRPLQRRPAPDSVVARAADTANANVPAPAGERLHQSKANPFAVHSWLPPVVKVKAPPPPPPRAPPLPFAYIGKMQDGAAVTAFVTQGGRSHVLHSGDTLSGYRVESITPTDMTFVYLPLNEKQRLTFGTEN